MGWTWEGSWRRRWGGRAQAKGVDVMTWMEMKMIKTELHMGRAQARLVGYGVRKSDALYEDSTNERADQLATIQNDRLELECQDLLKQNPQSVMYCRSIPH